MFAALEIVNDAVRNLITRVRPDPLSGLGLDYRSAHQARPDPPLTCADAAARVRFKVGDEVGLKSGGPAMTVVAVFAGEISCAWFDRHGDLEREEFLPACLVLFPSGPNNPPSEVPF